jgi:hypothetical protein
MPGAQGAVGRYVYVWVLLATLPFARRYHEERGIPDATSWEILAALGAQMANHRALFGMGGLHTQEWITVHFRGLTYALGRLHFERLPIWFDAEATAERHGPAPQRGEWSLGLHIPEERLSPAACDDSFARAKEFFPRDFAEEDHRYAVCTSWVLDPQLQEYLSPETNIVRFQNRLELLPPADGSNSATVEFVFRRPLAYLAALPQETTLRRAIVAHIRAGHDWKIRTGWFAL